MRGLSEGSREHDAKGREIRERERRRGGRREGRGGIDWMVPEEGNNGDRWINYHIKSDLKRGSKGNETGKEYAH